MTQAHEKFCRKCGSPTKLEPQTESFDPGTGEQLMRAVCSIDPCGHNFHDFGELQYASGFFGIFKDPTLTCRRCLKTVKFSN